MYHNAVLLNDCIEGLKIKPEGSYADVTFGGGGHSAAILEKLSPEGKLYAFDQDADALRNLPGDKRLVLIRKNFSSLQQSLSELNALPLNGILADLGVSSHQFDTPERGFSTRFDGPLDMRMDQQNPMSAAAVLNTYAEKDLKKIFSVYGEINNAGKLAKIISTERKLKAITTIAELKEVMEGCVTRGKENQYYAKVFQALRIEVNGELDALMDLLRQSEQVLRPGGRLVVIAYHSLEDRLVKNYLRSGKFEGDAEQDFYGNRIVPFEAITRKPIVPSEEEIENNNRARSAKLRIGEKKR